MCVTVASSKWLATGRRGSISAPLVCTFSSNPQPVGVGSTTFRRVIAPTFDEVVHESREGDDRRTLVTTFPRQERDGTGWHGRIERYRGQMRMVVRDGIRQHRGQ
jgi:hypothetical protein